MEKIEILADDLKKEIFARNVKKIIFIGGPDTGKTTLLKDVCKKLIEYKIPVRVVDCDVGQSFVGPPSTISSVKLKNRVFDFFPFPDKFYFTGSITPASNIIGFFTGIEKMRCFIEKETGKILIDTTGYIKDKLAIFIKIHKIEIFHPHLVILLEKKEELSEIKRFLKCTSINFFNIKIPEKFPVKTMEERSKNRMERFKKYFSKIKLLEIDTQKISLKVIGFRNISSYEEILSLNLKGAIVSLRDKNLEDRIIGVLLNKKGDKAEIIIPDKKVEFEIKGLCISNLFLNIEQILTKTNEGE